MKVNKEGNRIILEVEPSDIVHGDLEMTVDALYTGICTMLRMQHLAPGFFAGDQASMSAVQSELVDVANDLALRWELPPPCPEDGG